METVLSDGSQLRSRFYHPLLRGDFRQDWEAVNVDRVKRMTMEISPTLLSGAPGVGWGKLHPLRLEV